VSETSREELLAQIAAFVEPFCPGQRVGEAIKNNFGGGSAQQLPRVGRRGIYIASKTRHAGRWLALRAAGHPIISTWIDEAGIGASADLDDLWQRCISEAALCAVLIVYREPEDTLKGAWVEIGAALVRGTPVFAVGLRDYTIAKYHRVRHFDTVEEAFDVARRALGSPEWRYCTSQTQWGIPAVDGGES
jgi:hypothetical protein